MLSVLLVEPAAQCSAAAAGARRAVFPPAAPVLSKTVDATAVAHVNFCTTFYSGIITGSIACKANKNCARDRPAGLSPSRSALGRVHEPHYLPACPPALRGAVLTS
ncbi:hypothetical protein MTO96_001372 [Rhipicephalus appendiculatus]